VYLSNGIWKHKMFTVAPAQESTRSMMPQDAGHRCTLLSLTQIGGVWHPAGLTSVLYTEFNAN